MEPTLIASCVGIGVNTVTAVINGYKAFKMTNVEKYFKGLIESGQDLTSIGDKDELQRHFFSMVDKVANEVNLEKIESWKNAMVHLATDFKDFDFKDNFIRSLEDLTVFDLTVLHKIYSTEFVKEHFEDELFDFFYNREVPKDFVLQSLKRLSSYNLITEKVESTGGAFLSGGVPTLGLLYYTKNELGPTFIRFISDNFTTGSR